MNQPKYRSYNWYQSQGWTTCWFVWFEVTVWSCFFYFAPEHYFLEKQFYYKDFYSIKSGLQVVIFLIQVFTYLIRSYCQSLYQFVSLCGQNIVWILDQLWNSLGCWLGNNMFLGSGLVQPDPDFIHKGQSIMVVFFLPAVSNQRLVTSGLWPAVCDRRFVS